MKKDTIKSLENQIGVTLDDSITELPDDRLAHVGKSLRKLVIAYQKDPDVLQNDVRASLRDVEDAMEDKDAFWEIKELAYDRLNKIGKIDYLTTRGDGGINKQQNKNLLDEIHYFAEEMEKAASGHPAHIQTHLDVFIRLMKEYVLVCDGTVAYISRLFDVAVNEWEKRHPNPNKQEKKEYVHDPMTDDDWPEMILTDDIVDISQEDVNFWALQDELEEQLKRNDALEMLLGRAERLLSDEESTKAERDQLREDIRNQISTTSNVVLKGDDLTAQQLIATTKPEGKEFKLFIKSRHFKRNLILRYGIDLLNRDVVYFKCSRLAFYNCVWGKLKVDGKYLEPEIIVALSVSRKNKPDAGVPDWNSVEAYDWAAKTTMIDKVWGDQYLTLEKKYAPFSADYEGYSIKQLKEKHKLIMADLNEMKKRASA